MIKSIILSRPNPFKHRIQNNVFHIFFLLFHRISAHRIYRVSAFCHFVVSFFSCHVTREKINISHRFRFVYSRRLYHSPMTKSHNLRSGATIYPRSLESDMNGAKTHRSARNMDCGWMCGGKSFEYRKWIMNECRVTLILAQWRGNSNNVSSRAIRTFIHQSV